MKILLGISIAVITGLIISFSSVKGKQKNFTTQNIESDETGFAVIELFTSEGCSSCPPADALVEEVQKKYKNENVLVLGYHVDYWDRLGWKDPFSSAEYTKRQNYYADIFNLNSIYTPQIVVNGETEFVGSNRTKLLNAISENLKEKSESNINLKSSMTHDGKISVEYSANSINGTQEQLILLLVQKMATTKIKRGENAGKTLHHVNIVKEISFHSVSGNEQSFTLKLPDGLAKENFFVAAFIQFRNNGEIIATQTSEIN